MLRLWKWYQNCLTVHPVKTQMISSGVIWGLGDIAAQSITHYTAERNRQIKEVEKKLKISWKRVATTSLFGFAFVGPVGHFWYESLDRFIRSRLVLRPNSLRFVGAKVALDGIIFGPLDLFVFFSYMGFASGKSVPQIKEDLKRDFVPALILEGAGGCTLEAMVSISSVWQGEASIIIVHTQLLSETPVAQLTSLPELDGFVLAGGGSGLTTDSILPTASWHVENLSCSSYWKYWLELELLEEPCNVLWRPEYSCS
ncbi:PEROXISOMAL MEMBRANE PROTEIN 2 PXMP2 MPV17 [Salix viminalis]|uniref:PEROXISOMAL MEMBRANE PROTEIN 2 PXMP2 MPV17 n=1 Tax=Salix viminalis TaxID=40686 RepID=A0A9Q0NQK5_SALVM|nr:PEROXISOMAL MEMBRANE PROTEIN 2 PXMP2 MPV17 [Salix viminalis]